MKTVAIITHAYYRPHLSADEKISLEHLKKYLNKYDKYLVVPDDVNVNDIKQNGFRFIKFPRKHFVSAEAYNKLLLSEEYYQAFKDYKFILIYQLDALVFSDRLMYWCHKGYDNISAPWFYSIIGFFTHKEGYPISGGNGGFSLRKVESCLKVLKRVNKEAKRSSNQSWIRRFWYYLAIITGQSHKIWLKARAEEYPFNEDGFWSLEAPKYLSGFKVAPFKVAIRFSFETFPRVCFFFNKRRLPFGCHAWGKYDRGFWLRFL